MYSVWMDKDKLRVIRIIVNQLQHELHIQVDLLRSLMDTVSDKQVFLLTCLCIFAITRDVIARTPVRQGIE